VVAAVVATIAQVVEGPPGRGYGWGSVLISCVLLAVPLVGIGLMVRAGERRFAWPAVVVAALMVAVVLVALGGNWPEQSWTDRSLDSLVALVVIVACTGVILVEIPLLRRTGS
jgi:hypothetical protein